ncbi:MAG: AAA family ATPase [Hespellia sp.]|nr:AAA family ATPase [Hespellia sp.]
MQRHITEELMKWKNDKNKKAMLLTGARQIGKTYIIREFGKANYEHFIEINFVENQNADRIFEKASTADEMITNLTAYVSKKLVPGKTLIFLDEIQECPQARTAIKFLVDDGRFDYIESGSLLGVKNKEVKSYPVGYETIRRMYPMKFEEFLLANGVQQETFHYLKECYESGEAVSESVHETMNQLFRYYMIVGGMPDAVKTFVETHDIGKVVEIQSSILELYRQDIAKYAENDKAKIKDIFDRIPSELNEKNKRFILAGIQKSARMERYENSFLWLQDAGVALPCYNVTEPVVPLKINEKHNLFKLFLCDTGLLCAASLENVQFEILQNNLSVNMGGILENMFAQIFTANGFETRYYDKKGKCELDFLLQRGKHIIPIEIKSGESYKNHAAMDYALSMEQWQIENGIVFCSGNLEKQNHITYLPWYMSMFLEQKKVETGFIVDVNLEGLNDIKEEHNEIE